MQKIPKIIHYCWFGGNPKPQLVLNCIESWKKYCPDFEIREWNEQSFDINAVQYVKEAYEAKKWAFVSDYVRLYALNKFGGVYLDTDVQLYKPIDIFLTDDMFWGFESRDFVMTAIFGSKPGHVMLGRYIAEYNEKHFVKEDGSFDMLPNPYVITKRLAEKGLKLNGKKQVVEDFTVYPQIFFNPNNFARIWDKPSRKSFAVHHCDQSWRNRKQKSSFGYRVRRFLVGIMRNAFGTYKIVRFRKQIGDLLKKKR